VIWYALAVSSRIVQAELALGRGDVRSAIVLAVEELRTHPNSDRALMIAGSASLAMQDFGSAMGYFGQVSANDKRLSARSQRERGQIALNSGHMVLAEELLRKSLLTAPGDSTTLDQLIYLLTLEGRGWEAREMIFDRLRSGAVSVNYLVIAARPDRSLEISTQYSGRCLVVAPDEPLPQLALAQKAWRDNNAPLARELVERVLEKHPELIEAHALLCRVIVETGTSEEFQAVCDRLPETAQGHPEIWSSRGIWAENQGQTEAAARCYWESLQLNPNLPNANYRLSQTLVKLGKPDVAVPFAERAQQLAKLSLEMTSLSNGVDLQTLPEIISQLESLGRDWEAAGWCQMTFPKSGPQPAWAKQAQARLCSRLFASTSYTTPAQDPSRHIDLSHFALPILRNVRHPTAPSLPGSPSKAKIAFQDDASLAGLVFTYQNGASQGNLESMLEMNGGGVAVLDYDGDHWPDVFFTQGGALPPAPFDPAQSDQIFRNRGGTSAGNPATLPFQNVTRAAGIQDVGYGQGVTVGDFDNDGFPDLYVGNIGVNQLYRNQGDGTFLDVTSGSQTPGGGWTSSCVLADFNLDGLPDLYAVTYLGGDGPFTPCNKNVRPRCAPLNYPAEPDRFYLNLGDGRFQDLTEKHGLSASNGRGLGVVAADFDGSRRLSLFVANDMSANFYFHNQTSSPETIQFEEQALLSGLAFDQLGQSKACMGIAAGDYNQDERLDLFVTNFYRQANDLYVQSSDGTFRDRSRESKLFDPSFLVLGWGTQFLDGDLDGHPDLIVANGHVHDPVDPQIPYAMPAQFFHNLGNGMFAELPAEQLGEFFERRLLGRSLARIDWNRDGLDDVCLSNLNEPAALLTNRTDQPGRFLSFRLVAVDTARDAIGAKVRISIGQHVWTQQLTAGDGFQASNERRLVFGLGSQQTVESIEVLWPSGLIQAIGSLSSNREWLLVEKQVPIDVSASVNK
jgi:tetratricopeptide (TPR) repeat protein